jgi:hypothetical protein
METQFNRDATVMLNFNGKPMSRAYYNLVISKRDVGLFCKGIKPHRHWRFTDVKNYFGLKGNKQSVYAQLCKMVDELLSKNENSVK